MFEVQGSLKDFYQQAREIGLEYLGDFEEDFEPTDEFYDRDDPERSLSARVYLAMPTVAAWEALRGLWRHYKTRTRMPKGQRKWGELFAHLIDVRPWGPQDRIPADAVAAWRQELQRNPEASVRLEVELWYYESDARRTQAFGAVQAAVNAAGGAIVQHATIPQVAYDAALIDIPAHAARDLIEHRTISLARADDVMFLRPQSVMRHRAADDAAELEGPELAGPAADQDQQPIAALLDGLPVQNHVRLAGRLVIDDPDDVEPTYPVQRREHGTEMASLILHGDLNNQEAPLSRRLYVRPVMVPAQNGLERTPADRLLVDHIYRAVRRIKEGELGEPAAAPEVVLINFALADEQRPFARVMSPLGRLIDYLSHRYGVVFVVAAGNIMDRFAVAGFSNSIEFEAASPEARETAMLKALDANKGNRTLFSPAEAINAMTIGAAHAGSAFDGSLPAGMLDPFTDTTVPNVASAMGLGFRKAVKPELLFAGGRAPVRFVGSDDNGISVAPVRGGAAHFGVRAARPSAQGGNRAEDFTWGTSVAAALATRGAHRIYDSLMDIEGGSLHADIEPRYIHTALRSLLVHSAQWGDKAAALDQLLGPHGIGKYDERTDNVSRFLGYGCPNIERVLDCEAGRATMLGYGDIAADTALIYRIPLPEELESIQAFRALTMTLSWSTPTNQRHQNYRMAALELSPATEAKYWIAEDRESYQPTFRAVGRGTVIHERRSFEGATVFLDDGFLMLRVSCRAPAGYLAEPVPYALAVSFEVGVNAGIDVYDSVQVRLAEGVPTRVSAG